MFKKLDCKLLGTQIRERARRERSRGGANKAKKIRQHPEMKITKNPLGMI